MISEERPKRDLPEGVQWVDGSAGSVPEGAFAGGEDGGSPLYVARAEHEGATIPGKLLAEHGVAYVVKLIKLLTQLFIYRTELFTN